MPQSTLSNTCRIILLLLISFPSFAPAQKSRPPKKKLPPKSSSTKEATRAATPAATTAAPQSSGAARIMWEGNPKIARYRLQLARDEAFSDIVLDKLVMAREYTVTELAPGRYFWHVAPSAGETGVYSRPLPVTVGAQGTSSASNVPPAPLLAPPANIGWRTATGSTASPLAARLRAGANLDVVCVNVYGQVYAINGENGVALWAARYRPNAKKGEPTNSDGNSPPFIPLLMNGKNNAQDVLIAFESGVRALEGATGKELWRAALPGEAMSGVTLNAESGGADTLTIFDNSHTLSFLKSDTGQVVSQTKLEGFIVGSPVLFNLKTGRGMLLALSNGTLDARNMAGESVMAVRLDATLTTAPLLARSPRGQLVMIGTESGLVALDAADLNPLWRVATEGDAPQGMLAAFDLDGDGMDEVLMVTRRGRAVAVNVATGKIRWYAEGATDAEVAAFADVNGDGTRDVLVAGGKDFALGFSGRDGALVWKAEETNAGSIAMDKAAPPRALVAAPFGVGSPSLLVGADPARTGLRAVGLPVGALK